jgi:predicted nucleotidyltransferase
MYKNKLKFTPLQREIFNLLCIKVGKKLNQRQISKLLKVSPTAVSKALLFLEENKLANISKEENFNLKLVELNRDSEDAIYLKKLFNLEILYFSGLISYLENSFFGATLILFGSYSRGEDVFNSDIDIAVVGSNEKDIDFKKYERILERKININFYESFNKIHKNLRENLFNGVVLSGGIEL